MERRKLFVDDTREFPEWGYECCRDAESAMSLLSFLKFDLISLDYNLGMNRKSGLDILIWMKENDIFVPEINIHSNHIIGKGEMYLYCKEHFPKSKITLNTLSK